MVLKKAVAIVPTSGGASKPKLLEPKPSSGARSSKKLENFLCNME